MRKKALVTFKVVAIILVFCFGTVGCGSGAWGKKNDTSLENAKSAYSLLSSSSDRIETIGAGISGAWGYAIDNSNDYTGTYSGLAKTCGLSYEEISAAFDEYHKIIFGDNYKNYTDHEGINLSDFQDVIVVLTDFAYVPYFQQLDTDLATAKAQIQSVNESESYYTDLVDYYTAVSNYLEFCKSPTGSYQSLGVTRNEYITEISTAKSKLSFYLE